MSKDYRKMLEEIGGYDNELVGVPAGGVREMVDEIESLRQQLAEERTTLAHAAQIKEMDDKLLAAAIAACKLKDRDIAALLELHEIDNEGMPMLRWFSQAEIAIRVTEARKALSLQPDDAALKEWLGEPVATVDDAGVIVVCSYGYKPGDSLYNPKGLK